MAMRLFGIMFAIACIVLIPINVRFSKVPTPGNTADPNPINETASFIAEVQSYLGEDSKLPKLPDNTYLWAYLVFTYLFTALILYFIRAQTLRIIRVRQDYLGSQSTITDRTLKLTGVPSDLRTEDAIKELIEKLEIGHVESVTICRDWHRLDGLVRERDHVLRRLEEAWTVHLGKKGIIPGPRYPSDQVDGGSDSRQGEHLMGSDHVSVYDKPRPTTRVWHGTFKLQSQKVDAIDYYAEKLGRLDKQIIEARKREYKATPIAFVTMDSIPACQMAVQAVLTAEPGQLLAKLAPAPSDVVWRNTYLPRSSRMARSWGITIFILVLSIVWLVPVLLVAGLFDLCSIRQIVPKFATFLESHEILKSLVQTGLPTLVVSLLNLAVPFLYDWLANLQGTISQGDVELSVISKNFLFTFFNLFLVITIGGSASLFWSNVRDIKDTTALAYRLAGSVKELGIFYTNFILLQSVGLLPFRLLEFGSVSLYPIMRMGSKTPRDYAELVCIVALSCCSLSPHLTNVNQVQPPIFQYSFYLPSAILIFILCTVYSVLPAGYMVLFFGNIYFCFGYYTYKYQLLYAMDHPQHSTGGAWPMICYRIMLGMGVWQLVMAGLIALEKQFQAALLVVPLIPFTIWYSYYFGRTYEPLMNFIALRSIERGSAEYADEERPNALSRRHSTTVDESREKGQQFINPSLIVPLGKLWVDGLPDSHANDDTNSPPLQTPASMEREESTSSNVSNVSLGDTHIWRDNGNA